MATQFTLDDIRAAAEKEFGDVVIEGVVLTNALRLPKEQRKKLTDMQEVERDNDEDVQAFLEDTLRIVAVDKEAVEGLINECSGDLTILLQIIRHYNGETEQGEA